MRCKPFWPLALSAALVLIGLLSLTVPAVHASTATPQRAHHALASCAGTQCNGSDAYSSACAGNGASYWVVDSVPVSWNGVNDGWVQLWYSGTCGTNWARYVCAASCRAGDLTLFVCESGFPAYGVQGPLFLTATGRTTQYYLPTTPAAASFLFEISGSVFSGATTGCY